ncbi:MAG: hypothetical protein HY709_02480 [Candidatus Latescibacteria bacterium]|nr:hypothetical protein [Candidatus Latescibacterota bacterium]
MTTVTLTTWGSMMMLPCVVSERSQFVIRYLLVIVQLGRVVVSGHEAVMSRQPSGVSRKRHRETSC